MLTSLPASVGSGHFSNGEQFYSRSYRPGGEFPPAMQDCGPDLVPLHRLRSHLAMPDVAD